MPTPHLSLRPHRLSRSPTGSHPRPCAVPARTPRIPQTQRDQTILCPDAPVPGFFGLFIDSQWKQPPPMRPLLSRPPCTYQAHPIESIYHHYPISPPASPYPRCFRGFGKLDPNRQTKSYHLNIYLVVHLTWGYMDPRERSILGGLFPVFRGYARLRQTAASLDLRPLLQPRLPPDKSPIDQHRVTMMGCALLRFNFNYGHLGRAPIPTNIAIGTRPSPR